MNDLISRQAAIDALRMDIDIIPYAKAREYARSVIETVYNRLEELPSAPPVGKDINVPNNDTISRAAAIGEITEYGSGDAIYMSVVELKRRIEQLPSAQPDIIRCRKCKFASGDSRICMKFGHSPIGELDFCAWAERREE